MASALRNYVLTSNGGKGADAQHGIRGQSGSSGVWSSCGRDGGRGANAGPAQQGEQGAQVILWLSSGVDTAPGTGGSVVRVQGTSNTNGVDETLASGTLGTVTLTAVGGVGGRGGYGGRGGDGGRGRRGWLFNEKSQFTMAKR